MPTSLVREHRAISYGQRQVIVDDEFMRCSECGEEFHAPGQADATDRRAAELVRKGNGILPFEVRAIRKQLNRSQRELEIELGLGEKVVTRWERGINPPDPTTIILLRALESGLLSLEDLRAAREGSAPQNADEAAYANFGKWANGKDSDFSIEDIQTEHWLERRSADATQLSVEAPVLASCRGNDNLALAA